MTAKDHALRVRIAGKVQGVGYRAWTQRQAVSLGLKGWVRNEPDGSVTALIVGSAAATQAMLEHFRRGPPGSSVSDVEPRAIDLDEVPDGFGITR